MYKRLLLTTSMLTIAACSSFKEYNVPNAPAGFSGIRFDGNGIQNQRIAPSETVSAWWNEFDDLQLGNIIEQALTNNLDIRVAYANLNAARAIARETGFDRYPSANLNASYARNRLSNESLEINNVDTNTISTHDSGFDAQWELDLFGRVSNRIRAARANSDAALADAKDVQTIIAAEVARTYIELRGAQYRLGIAKRNATNQQRTLKLTKDLAQDGVGSGLDIAQAKTQFELTQAIIPSREAEVTAAINRLSVLTGQVPDALRYELENVKSLPSLPITINVGNAGDLLKRRPDIERAERELAAATARYNVAAADQFPAVSIIGSLGFVATDFSNFGDNDTLAGAIGPNLNWGLLDFGRIRSRIKQNDARTEAALANYERTVLNALEETQTAISDFSQEERRRAHLQNAARASVQATTIASKRFEFGDTDFLPVLDSERVRLETEDALAVSETQAALNLIRIYKALGTGWEIEPSVK